MSEPYVIWRVYVEEFRGVEDARAWAERHEGTVMVLSSDGHLVWKAKTPE
jgi:hypothetical protein